MTVITNGVNERISKGQHIASMVLGIISIMSSFFWYITLPAGVLAVVLGSKTSGASGFGKAGLVTGTIGLSLFTFFYFTMITFILLDRAS